VCVMERQEGEEWEQTVLQRDSEVACMGGNKE
jgi:hypothetical protein